MESKSSHARTFTPQAVCFIGDWISLRMAGDGIPKMPCWSVGIDAIVKAGEKSLLSPSAAGYTQHMYIHKTSHCITADLLRY